MVAIHESKEIIKVITIHLEDKMNVCTTISGNPFSSCWDLSLKATNVNLVVVQEDHQHQ